MRIGWLLLLALPAFADGYEVATLECPESIDYRVCRDLDGDGIKDLALVAAGKAWIWKGTDGRFPKAPDVRIFAEGVSDRVVAHAEANYGACIASGSYPTIGMAVCPCSMGTLGRIAAGTGESLVTRAADVCLKERRRLVLVPRESPLSLLHLENMARLTRAGAVVLPASPGFYHAPERIEDLVSFVVARVIEQFGLPQDLVDRWEG